MIEIIETTNPKYTDEWGAGFLVMNLKNYLVKVPTTADLNPMIIGDSNQNPWVALANRGVKAHEMREKSAYDCPISAKTFTAVVPLRILTSDTERYNIEGRKWADMARDTAWNQKSWDDLVVSVQRSIALPKITTILLGTGYTHGTLPSDGSSEQALSAIPLENGDHVLVANMEWYNK